jgi:hypothetical protein
VVGKKAEVGTKVAMVGVVFFQVPATGGARDGMAATLAMGAESWTATVVSVGTLVAPDAGVVETMVKGGAATVLELLVEEEALE